MPLFPILAILVTTAAAMPYPNSSLSRASVTTTPVYEGQCPHPFTAVEGEHCYFLSYGAIRQTWKNAQLFCRWIHPGSRLAEFETPEELNVATQFLTTDYLEGALTLDHNWPSVGPWIGAIEIGNTGLFAWASDMKTPILGTCTNWAASKPQGLSTPEDAVALQPPYFNWVDFQNDLELPFICEVKANPRPVVVPQNCPSGFTKLSTGCYNFITTSRSWDSSQSFCRSLARGSKLAEFETEEENYVVVYYMVRYKPCENGCSARRVESPRTPDPGWATLAIPEHCMGMQEAFLHYGPDPGLSTPVDSNVLRVDGPESSLEAPLGGSATRSPRLSCPGKDAMDSQSHRFAATMEHLVLGGSTLTDGTSQSLGFNTSGLKDPRRVGGESVEEEEMMMQTCYANEGDVGGQLFHP
ncbi:unnamed protein product [Cyprideis torosa]|uniref:Uncharacterized protein n=1 Tax=Cyprideis torosa TaxID=163714 RepID=A0A7R8WLD1_9CRUS|nr:unnamed protein product [Cyprideis torosa]CAG0904191.1 unnamed protein product [Cyprideis torosa]